MIMVTTKDTMDTGDPTFFVSGQDRAFIVSFVSFVAFVSFVSAAVIQR